MPTGLQHIVTVSYMGSGSSAVTDLLREYENVDCPNGSYEYIFLHCPDGVFDLEDKLLHNNNALRSDEALRSFRFTMNELFENTRWWFGNYKNRLSSRFMEYVDQFISQITTCTYEGFWYEHEKASSRRIIVGRQLAKLGLEPRGFRHRYPDWMQVAFPSANTFYDAANLFIDNVFADTFETNKIALLDQLFLPHNLDRVGSYFPHTKYLLVRRDPRDVFILNKYVWTKQGCPIPFPKEVNEFCTFYAAMVSSTPPVDDALVQQIWFEDLILEHNSTLEQIERFLGSEIGIQTDKGKFLVPTKSARNIGVYKDDPAFAQEADTIATKLEKYLYPKPIDAAFSNRNDEVF